MNAMAATVYVLLALLAAYRGHESVRRDRARPRYSGVGRTDCSEKQRQRACSATGAVTVSTL